MNPAIQTETNLKRWERVLDNVVSPCDMGEELNRLEVIEAERERRMGKIDFSDRESIMRMIEEDLVYAYLRCKIYERVPEARKRGRSWNKYAPAFGRLMNRSMKQEEYSRWHSEAEKWKASNNYS